MLMRVLFQTTEVGLAKIVMPRSRSRSLLSIARSVRGLVFAIGAGLFQKLVNQRRFAVVNVSDDCDVTHVHWGMPLIREGAAHALAPQHLRSAYRARHQKASPKGD